jgi:hypothetical protein
VSLAATLPLAVLAVLYHQAGRFPYRLGGLAAVLGACALAQLLLPARPRVLRLGALAYGAAAAVAFLVPNPVGGNMSRLGAVLAFPVLASAMHPRRRLLAVAAVPLLAWQWSPAFAGITGADRDASSRRAYFEPLVAELALLDGGPTRVEIPFTAQHWEAAWVAGDVALARGWERQLDIARNQLFYERGPLSADAYRRWLDDSGVMWVALPDVPLDYSAREEAALLLGRPPDYLEPVWHNDHWRLWRVTTSPGLVSGPARLTTLSSDSFTVEADAAASVVVRVRDSAAWQVVEGAACLDRSEGGWILLRVGKPGPVRVAARLLPNGGTRC